MTAPAARRIEPRIRTRGLHPLFGLEIAGIDLSQPVDDETFEWIRYRFEVHSVLVFRDAVLTDDRQIAFSERFGPLETMLSGSMKHGRHIADLSNVDAATGAIIPPDDKRMVRNAGNEMWHTDSSFKRVPAKASLLSGREVPPVGGATEFASMRAAWDDLPAERRAELDGLVAEHSFAYSRGLIDPTLLDREQKDEVPPVPHPLVRTNPVTQRRALYVGAHASHIVGRPVAEGRALLRELTDFATQTKYVYRHQWRQHDLVMWDNRAVLHHGTDWDKATYRRVMHRTTVAGAGPTAELLADGSARILPGAAL